MSSMRFLEDVVTGDCEYWLVAKETVGAHGLGSRGDDDVYLIAIPHEVERNVDFNELKVKDVNRLKRVEVKENMPLSGDYPPFQYGQRLGDFYNGYPLDGEGVNVKHFLKAAFDSEKKDIWSYKELFDSMVQDKKINTGS